jgi:hypothetical protein
MNTPNIPDPSIHFGPRLEQDVPEGQLYWRPWQPPTPPEQVAVFRSGNPEPLLLCEEADAEYVCIQSELKRLARERAEQ